MARGEHVLDKSALYWSPGCENTWEQNARAACSHYWEIMNVSTERIDIHELRYKCFVVSFAKWS